MKLYNKYISYKILISFLALSFLLITLIWFSRAIAFVSYITENGVEIKQFSLLFVLILPWLLLFIVPVSVFAAVLLIYNRLILNNEITILKNAGLTKIAISRPAIFLGVFFTIFCFSVSFYLMPLANKNLRLIRLNFENNYSNLSFTKGTFEVLKNLTIYAKDKNEQNQLFGILLNDARNDDYSLTITAKSGNLKSEDGGLLLYMNEGSVQRYVYKNNKEEILNFDNYVFNLSEGNKGTDKQKRWKAKERFLTELINPKDNSEPSDIARYKIELQQRITYPLISLVLVMIALACILNGDFNRRGSIANIVLAIFLGIVFFGITIAIYRVLETNFYLLPMLYLHFALSFIASFYVLKVNN